MGIPFGLSVSVSSPIYQVHPWLKARGRPVRFSPGRFLFPDVSTDGAAAAAADGTIFLAMEAEPMYPESSQAQVCVAEMGV